MIKQPLLPLKWYNELDEQQFRKLQDTTAQDWVKLRMDVIMSMPFQIKRDDRPNNISQFDLVDYDTGVVANIGLTHLDIKSAAVDGTTYNYIVCDGRPWNNDMDEGFYYFIIADGVEIWYSEVFELCDLYTNLIDDGVNDSFDNFVDDSFPLIKRERWGMCKSTAAGIAFAYSNEFEVIYNEPLELYIYAFYSAVAGCGIDAFGDNINYELRDATGNVVSNVVTAEEYWNCFTLTPTFTGTVRLYAWMADTEQAEQVNYIYLWPKKITDHSVLEWSNSINFCDIIYVDTDDNNNCDYVNKLLLYKSHVIKPTYAIEADAVETDEKETFPLVQAAQKYYNLEFAGGHHLSDAMSIVRLHDDIKFYLETGEIIDVCDFSMNNSPIASNDYCELIDITFRELACVKDGCEHYTASECCCPVYDNVVDFEPLGPPSLPACNAGTDGERWMVTLGGGVDAIYQCTNGVGWARVVAEEEIDSCVWEEDAERYWVWDDTNNTFIYIALINTVTDNTDGTATINITCARSIIQLFSCTYYLIAIVDGVMIGSMVLNEIADSTGITVTTGPGNFDFQVMIFFNHNCVLSYSNTANQTITDV